MIGDEEAVLQNPLHHGVAALLNLNDPGLVHIRPAVVVAHRHGGEGHQRVQFRYRGGGFLNAHRGGGDLLPQGGKELVLQRHHPLRGGENLVLQVLEFLGNEALAVDQGLFADVGVRHLIFKRIADLDVVSEDLVIADFQRPDAGFLLLPGLHLRNDAFAPLEDVPQTVHLLVKAVPDEAPLPDGEGRLVADGPGNPVPEVFQHVQLRRQLSQAAVLHGGELGLDLRQPFHGRPEGRHVPPAGGAVDDAAEKPLHVAQARHGGAQLLPGDGGLHQRRNRAGTAVDGRDGEQGPLQPAP